MSGSNCCFLTCIQVSQETGQVVWDSHLFQNFPQLIVIHTKVLVQSIKQKWMFFWNSLAFLMIQQMLAIWSLVPLPFLKPVWTSGSSQFTYCWSLARRILSITCMWDECICAVVWAFFRMSFLGIGMKTDLFQSCDHCWVFQICWHIECSTFTASSFRIWNSSPPLALFIVMLPKAHLTSHSGMSISRWVITPSWLSRSWRSFLYSSSVYSYHLFLLWLHFLILYCFPLSSTISWTLLFQAVNTQSGLAK